jgi:hypothetical protein
MHNELSMDRSHGGFDVDEDKSKVKAVSLVVTENIACAITIGPEGQKRLTAAAGMAPRKWEDREFSEPEAREQARRLTGQDFDDIITEDDILTRRLYRCAVCDGCFTTDQYWEVRNIFRQNGQANPFRSGAETHLNCVGGQSGPGGAGEPQR